MGNLHDAPFERLLDTPAYAASIDRDNAQRARYCDNCEYSGFCNGWPIFASRQEGNDRGRCPIAYRIFEFMERLLREHGFDEQTLRAMLSEQVSSWSSRAPAAGATNLSL